jgi:hypothetical protein
MRRYLRWRFVLPAPLPSLHHLNIHHEASLTFYIEFHSNQATIDGISSDEAMNVASLLFPSPSLQVLTVAEPYHNIFDLDKRDPIRCILQGATSTQSLIQFNTARMRLNWVISLHIRHHYKYYLWWYLYQWLITWAVI